jgi:hypothetical protein
MTCNLPVRHRMTETEFLTLLNTIDFPRRYWELCDRHPLDPSVVGYSGRKEDILAAFRDMGITPRYRDRTYTCEEEQIGGFLWSAHFCKQRSGLELLFDGESKGACIGNNFAGLAYDAMKLADPSFERDRFSGPPPYPRPAHNGDPATLKAIIREFVTLVRLIKDAIRSRELSFGAS